MTAPAARRRGAALAQVRAPRPLLSPDKEKRLSVRQRQIIDELEALVVRGGLADQTMAQVAATVNCSLRTLYGIAGSKDELLLAIVDRRLQRIGRAAIGAIDPRAQPLDALRNYLRAVHEAVQPTTAEFARDFAGLSGGIRLLDEHESYVIAVAKSLLDRAVAERQIAPVDTAALAHVLGSLGREFSRPDLLGVIVESPKNTADAMAEIVLRGLV